MCRVCQANQSTRAVSRALRMARAFGLAPKEECKAPLEFYQNLDTSTWDIYHRALVRAQISNYNSKCNLYYDTIIALQEHYQQVLSSGE